jgi:hypothetical protein
MVVVSVDMRNLAAILFLVAACGSKPAEKTTPVNTSTDIADPAEADVPRGPVTLDSLEAGDRACYVGVTLPDGTARSLEGSFELCTPATETLIGTTVLLEYEKGNVLAAECEGDVDCGKSDEVDLVVTIKVQ